MYLIPKEDILSNVREEKNELVDDWCRRSNVTEPVGYVDDIICNRFTIYTTQPDKLMGINNYNIRVYEEILLKRFNQKYTVEIIDMKGRIVNNRTNVKFKSLEWDQIDFDKHLVSNNVLLDGKKTIFNKEIRFVFEIIKLKDSFTLRDNYTSYNVDTIDDGKKLAQELFNKYCQDIIDNISLKMS